MVMNGSQAMRNGALLGRGVRAFSIEVPAKSRRFGSISSAQDYRSQKMRRANSWRCEGCRRLHGVAASPPPPPLRRSSSRGFHQSSLRSFRGSGDLSSSKAWHTEPAKPPTAHPDTTIPLPEQLRTIMRLLAHSVVVCTATQNSTLRAMTMSSFTSLTLFPTPLITFNVATPSRTLDAIASSGAFNVHVLAGDPNGAAVASHFTRGNVGGHVLDGLEDVVCDAKGVLRGKGVLYALRCRVLLDAPEEGLLKVRDHVIVVGEVIEMVPVTEAEEFGLVYADRRYRQVGGVLSMDWD